MQINNTRLPPQLNYLDGLVLLVDATLAATEKAIKKARRPARIKPGLTLQPGSETPLWNELAGACEARLTKYGDKVRLARVLGISKQRLHQLLVEKSACADAERTLQLLLWLKAREKGLTPS